MARDDDRFIYNVVEANPEVKGVKVPSLESVREAIRRLQMDIYKIEGRLGESTIRDDIRILGAWSMEGRTETPPISEINEATIYLPNDGETGLQVSQHGSPYEDLIKSTAASPTDTSFFAGVDQDGGWAWDFHSVDYWSNATSAGGSGTAFETNAEDGHVGIVTLSTGTTINTVMSTWIPVANSVALILWKNFDGAGFVFKTPSTIANVRFEAGASSNAGAGWPTPTFQAGSDMLYFHFDSSVDNALRFKVRAGGSTTSSTVIINPCPTSTWIACKMKKILNGTAYDLDVYANNEKKVTVPAASLPSDANGFGLMARIENLVAADRRLPVDAAFLSPTSPLQRFTVDL